MSSSEEFDDSMSDASSIGDYDMDDDFMVPDIDDVESMASDDDDIVGALTADLTEEEQALLEASMASEGAGLRRSRRQRKVVERYEDPDFVRLMSDNGKDLPGYFDEMEEEDSSPDSTYIEEEESAEESEFSAASEH